MWKPSALCVGLLGLVAWATTAQAEEVPDPVTLAEYEAAFDAALEEFTERGTPVASRRIVPYSYRARAPRAAGGNRWRFTIAPYAFLANADGDAWTNGEKTSFEIPFEDILDVTNGGFQLYLEARYGRWFFAFDGTIAHLGDSEQRHLFGYEVTIDQIIADLRVGWRFKRWVLSRGPGMMGAKDQRTVDAYVFAGARYFRTDNETQRTILGIKLPKVRSRSEDLDPLLGLRVTADLSRRWTFDLRGEAAALGTSRTDQYSWEAAAYLGYHLSRHWTAFVGWRAQGQVDIEGTGPTKNGTDIVSHGPVIGVAFSF